MWKQKRSQACISVVAAVIVASGALSGCSASDSLEGELKDLVSNGRTFELPVDVAGRSWQELLILCPYDGPPEDVHAAFIDAATRVDSETADHSQWLLFRKDAHVTTVAISRTEFEFCSTPQRTGTTYAPAQRWQPNPSDGAVTVTPVR